MLIFQKGILKASQVKQTMNILLPAAVISKDEGFLGWKWHWLNIDQGSLCEYFGPVISIFLLCNLGLAINFPIGWQSYCYSVNNTRWKICYCESLLLWTQWSHILNLVSNMGYIAWVLYIFPTKDHIKFDWPLKTYGSFVEICRN